MKQKARGVCWTWTGLQDGLGTDRGTSWGMGSPADWGRGSHPVDKSSLVENWGQDVGEPWDQGSL